MRPNDNVNVDITVRDGEMNRMARLDNRRPQDVVNILNSVFFKQSSKQRLKLVVIRDKELEEEIKSHRYHHGSSGEASHDY